ncbi:MAG: hypothetical protein A3H29_16100 [Acidobacteria bacterium RIFCSPLOWO2_02_FULL_67_21]|nr:MAG: hypothetical protein A3H29_16100 [Acidobacteria bacterium RIFCSPLOWO2_02_FULL_67_21]
MPSAPAVNPLSPEQSAALADFARACRTAARSVSLYPATHPSIQASLTRVVTAAGRLIPAADLLLTVYPDVLVIEGRAPARPETAIVELAALMHERLVGALRVSRLADALDWHALLLLLSRPPEELIAEGGIAKAWAATGRANFEIREIDYAEVLRERAGGDGTQWDAIITYCLQGGSGPLDEAGLAALLGTLGKASEFAELLERLQGAAAGGDATVGARAAALLTLIRRMLEATAQWPKGQGEDAVLQTAATAMSRLTPEMMLEIIRQTVAPEMEQAHTASALIGRLGDETIASFVAGSIVQTRGASDRLAQAFEALVPELDHKERLLSLAREKAGRSALGQEANFEDLWQSAAQMLTSYSDERFVSSEYARELSSARRQAVDVERVSDDPPDRIQAWLTTISDEALKDLDRQLLHDLLQVEADAEAWADVARLAVTQIERLTLAGHFQPAHTFAFAIVRETGADGRPTLGAVADTALDRLAGGPLVRHLAHHLRRAEDVDLEPATRLCHTIGTRIVRPLAEVLLVEENARAIRRLRELLFGFGAAGRDAVERLKMSSNPAVRRTAIDLLRMFGGTEALGELATMLEDADPQVQREAVRAIIQTGIPEAFAILQRALLQAGTAATILQELIGLRDDRVVPLLASVLCQSSPRGEQVSVHTQIMDALGGLGDHAEATRALRIVLHRGEWWAPFRTAALRRAAAAALRRIGTSSTLAVLEEAVKTGSRGVRNAARAHVRPVPQRQRQHT